jgi:hypothetical protein
VIEPEIVIFPILLDALSVNHTLPSGPDVIPSGQLPAGNEYSVTVPEVVILPILSVSRSVNHRLPSGPDVICCAPLFPGKEYSVDFSVRYA